MKPDQTHNLFPCDIFTARVTYRSPARFEAQILGAGVSNRANKWGISL